MKINSLIKVIFATVLCLSFAIIAKTAASKTESSDCTKKQLAVTFDSQDGRPVKLQCVNIGKIPKKPSDPSKPGYVFAGWYDAALQTAFNFTTPIKASVTVFAKWIIKDADGNVYTEVTIGMQTWMKENLKTTSYNDGTAIQNVIDNAAWAALKLPGYCWYNNNKDTSFGALYNWAAVNTGKLAPKGWHVATDEEWTKLESFIGGDSVAAGKLKEIGIKNWSSPNSGATDAVGFSALPGGFRYSDGSFKGLTYSGNWWSSTEYDTADALVRGIGSKHANVDEGKNANKIYGFSVRCILD
jgi:uncharacterized protein (TIGR02145 family)/uncharacterized repeat protein (TIGR02543 family)